MKISGDIFNVSKVYGKQSSVNKVGKTSSVAAKKDVVSISNSAKDYQTISKALKDVPDVRQGKVDELSDVYNSGRYDVSGQQILDKLGKSVLDKKA